MSVSELFHQQILIDPRRIPMVILSALGIYLAFLVLLRVFGPRMFTNITELDAVVLIMFGAVAGRVVIGHPPTLMSGIVALCTLIILERSFGAMRRASGDRRLVMTNPRVLIAHGRILEREMRRCRISHAELWSVLRRNGITGLSQVAGLIVEPTGNFSVLRDGGEIDPRVLRGVIGAQLILDPEPDGDGGRGEADRASRATDADGDRRAPETPVQRETRRAAGRGEA